MKRNVSIICKVVFFRRLKVSSRLKSVMERQEIKPAIKKKKSKSSGIDHC